MFVFKVIVLLSIFAHIDHVQCQEGVIMTGPQTQIVAPGELVVFNCHARGNTVYWYINGYFADPQIYNEAEGFSISNDRISHPPDELEEHNNTMTVEARPSNNYTLISCTAAGTRHNQQDFQEGYLIIAGPPLAPAISLDVELLESDNGSFLFILSWTMPFSWSGFPVTGYKIMLSNYSSDETYNISFRIPTGDNETESYLIPFNSTGNDCYRLDFFVSANNSLGEGEVAVIHSGHPIIEGEIGDLEMVVTFLSNGTPHFWMSFLAPKICPEYQSGTYNITVYSNESYNLTLLHHFGPTTYTQENESEQELVVKEVKDGFIFRGHYEVSVSAETFGITQSKSRAFHAVFDHDSCKPTPDDGNVIGISVAIISMTIIGLLLVIIAILLYLLSKQKRKTGNEIDGQCMQAASSTTRRETCNPIYEGAFYETTPGESLSSLIPRSSTPDSTHHYVQQPPSLPPPRGQSTTEPMDEIDAIKASLKQANKWPESEIGDVYVVMGPNSMTATKEYGNDVAVDRL